MEKLTCLDTMELHFATSPSARPIHSARLASIESHPTDLEGARLCLKDSVLILCQSVSEVPTLLSLIVPFLGYRGVKLWPKHAGLDTVKLCIEAIGGRAATGLPGCKSHQIKSKIKAWCCPSSVDITLHSHMAWLSCSILPYFADGNLL